MKKSAMTASRLRGILIFCIIAGVILACVGFYFANQFLTGYAVTVSHALADSTASSNNVSVLQTIQKELNDQESVESKAADVVSPLGTYQSQVITDLDNYASLTGVSITNYSFGAASATAAAPVATAGAGTAPTSSVVVTVTSPVSYTSLLKFIRAIENNLPKMQITSLNISTASDAKSDDVSTQTLTINVFTR
jgi:hypothetical protein